MNFVVTINGDETCKHGCSKGRRMFVHTGALQRGGGCLCLQVPFKGEVDVCAHRCPSKGRRMFASTGAIQRRGGCLRLQVPFKGEEDVCTGALQRGGGYGNDTHA